MVNFTISLGYFWGNERVNHWGMHFSPKPQLTKFYFCEDIFSIECEVKVLQKYSFIAHVSKILNSFVLPKV